MLKQLKSFEALVIFFLYLLPVLLWSWFGFSQMSLASHWTLFSMGLILSAFSGLALWMLTSNKKPAPAPVITPPPEPIKEYVPNPINEQLQKEKEMLEAQIEKLKEKLSQTKTDSDTLESLERTLAAKEKEIETLTKKAGELELKVGELEYEIKALIDFNQEAERQEPIALTEQDAGRILRKWIDAASALNDSELQAQEQLSRLMQGEPSALIFLYRRDQERLISSNSHTLTLFNLTPEQFAEKFHTFIPKDSLEWHTALNHLSDTKWSGLDLKDAKAIMGQIPKGPLRGTLLGVAF
ncbi:MAG: hypothetical protein KDK62_04885 [Chlamydiia bacterium]|nr:hypothetical protein [Chlamydiia bacterium]